MADTASTEEKQALGDAPIPAETGVETPVEQTVDEIIDKMRREMQILCMHRHPAVVERLLCRINDALREKLQIATDDKRPVMPNQSSAPWSLEEHPEDSENPATNLERRLLTLRAALTCTPDEIDTIQVLDTNPLNCAEVYEEIRTVLVDDKVNDNLRLDFTQMLDVLREALKQALEPEDHSSDKPPKERCILVLGRKSTIAQMKPKVFDPVSLSAFQYPKLQDQASLEEALDGVKDADIGDDEPQSNLGTVANKIIAEWNEQSGDIETIVCFVDNELTTIPTPEGTVVVDAVTAYAEATAQRMIDNAKRKNPDDKPEKTKAKEKSAELLEEYEEERSPWTGYKRTWKGLMDGRWRDKAWRHDQINQYFHPNCTFGQWTIMIASFGISYPVLAARINMPSVLSETLEFTKDPNILVGAFALSVFATFLNANRDTDTLTEKRAVNVLTFAPPIVMGTAISALALDGAPVPFVVAGLLIHAMLAAYYKISAMSRKATQAIISAFVRFADKVPVLSQYCARLMTPRPNSGSQNPKQADLVMRGVMTGQKPELILREMAKGRVVTKAAHKGRADQDFEPEVLIATICGAAADVRHFNKAIGKRDGDSSETEDESTGTKGNIKSKVL